MNKCCVCGEVFDVWVDYQEHINLGHGPVKVLEPVEVIEEAAKPVEVPSMEPAAPLDWMNPQDEVMKSEIKVFSSGRRDLGRQVYPGPMNAGDKAKIVKAGELRLGPLSFFGKEKTK